MEYEGNQNSVSDLQIAVVTKRIDEFTRTMVVMPDFFVTVDERNISDTTVPDRNVCSSAVNGNMSTFNLMMSTILACS
jgi:hypothetical protein